MIGKLKKVSVRDRYDTRVARVVVDIPMQDIENESVDNEEAFDFLTANTSNLIGFDVTALEDQDQETIMENYDKV